MTKKELIQILSSFPDDSIIHIEGCDCEEEANGAIISKKGTILITREDGVYTSKDKQEWIDFE